MKTQIMKLIDSHGVCSEATADKIMNLIEQNRCEVVDKIEKTQSEFVAFFEACESFEGANLAIELLEDLTKIKSLLQTGDDWVSVDEFKRDDGRKYPIMVNGSPIFYWIAEYVGQKYPQIGYVDVQKGDKWYSAYSTGSQELEPLYVKRFNQPQPRLPDNTAKKDGK